MIEVSRYLLPNGLKMLHHFDNSTQMVALNIIYDVGSKDEDPSVNILDFDTPLQKAGGDNNAWTSNDITNYYSVVPRQNVETAFWLESDRMLELNFSEKSLSVQKQVVCEEFKQRNLNIENATLEDVKTFFYKHYAPNNAILSIAGNISFEDAVRLTEKWFGPIPRRNIAVRNLPEEPEQKESRFLEVYRSVPLDAITKAWHMCRRTDKEYHSYDLLSDILSNGRSSRLYRHLVMERKMFSDIDASITGDIDAGLFVVTGRLNKGITMEDADEAIKREVSALMAETIEKQELEKVVNKFESNHLFSNINYLNKATNLAYHELIGRAEDINEEVKKYWDITPQDLRRAAQKVFREENSSTLYYRAQ